MTRSIMAVTLLAVAGCAMRSGPKMYEVHSLPQAGIKVDGAMEESAWKTASILKDFTYPWEKRPAPSTQFRAVCDHASFFFCFEVQDSDIVAAEAFADESVVNGEDRVEVFMSCDTEMKRYYCLEIDPLARVHDYAATYYRKFDSSWNCPGLRVAASRSGQGYVVEGSIPLATLESLGLWSRSAGLPLRAGVFRAEFSHTRGGPPEEHWISWIDPGTREPDFHVPGSLGSLRLGRCSTGR